MKYQVLVTRAYKDIVEIEEDSPEEAIKKVINEKNKTITLLSNDNKSDITISWILDEEHAFLGERDKVEGQADTYILENGTWTKFKPRVISYPE